MLLLKNSTKDLIKPLIQTLSKLECSNQLISMQDVLNANLVMIKLVLHVQLTVQFVLALFVAPAKLVIILVQMHV